MQSVLEFLVHFLMAITGALGLAIAWVGALALLGAFGLVGGGALWRTRRRDKEKPPED
ncbi:hypothetical protein [Aurantiacibacter rhizosphaerae]|uniref:Uncharacterized protein n=1 Tax=Aurantiacibacter rhizosphaerae TaxID=2691582 RepID=A0A844X9W2_9SPHN|nr:hypothetical protein [Aurantiacibacter rhizosphaerae]MWV26736.1 hypothetical protein [Aurantiacibacter rhizosphaerae]